MKTLVVVCNIVFFAFTCLVLATDGLPKEAPYMLLTLVVLLVPVFTVLALVTPSLATAAVVANILMLAVMGWAFAAQYPHPQEEGFLEYTVLAALTPVLSVVVLLLTGRRRKRQQPQMSTEPLHG